MRPNKWKQVLTIKAYFDVTSTYTLNDEDKERKKIV